MVKNHSSTRKRIHASSCSKCKTLKCMCCSKGDNKINKSKKTKTRRRAKRVTKGGAPYVVDFALGFVKGFLDTRKKYLSTRKHKKQRGGDWGITNSFRGLQYNLVKLGNSFSGEPTPASSNPYPTQGQYSK